jgi:hypothetical protein
MGKKYIYTDTPGQYSCATVGWQTVDLGFWGIKEGYKDAANNLVDIALQEGDRNNILVLDTYIFPIMFLYRHSAEVSLKIIYHRCFRKIPSGGHNLVSLWKNVYNDVIVDCLSNTEFLEKVKTIKSNFIKFDITTIDFSKISKIFSELQSVDQASDLWRYLADKKAKPYLQNQIYVDYHQLKNEMNEILEILGFLYGVISEYLSD